MAALPPALNIFVIATQYNVGVERASACVLIGTLASMVTLTGLLLLITHRAPCRTISFPETQAAPCISRGVPIRGRTPSRITARRKGPIWLRPEAPRRAGNPPAGCR